MKKVVAIIVSVLLAANALADVHYVFHNTSSVNQLSFTDDEIYINIVIPVPGYVGYYSGAAEGWKNIYNAPTYTWPNGTTERNLCVKLSDLPKDANGNYYIDIPAGASGRLYIAYGQPLYRPDMNNPLLDDPANPNYMTKTETIEFTVRGDGMIFTNTSRVDRYAYPLGEELFCSDGSYDKVGETVSHEMVIQKWKRFVHDAFQYSYDATRDVIWAPKGTSYFYKGNPGEGYFDDFVNQLFTYYRTHTLRTLLGGTVRTATVNDAGNLVWDNGFTMARSDFDNFLLSSSSTWNPAVSDVLGQQFYVSMLRGAVLLTEDVQDWSNPDNYWKNDIRSDYMAFFHSDLVSYNSKTYAYDYDDYFDQSSTQACYADSVVLSLGGFGVEHTQTLDKVYITPLDGDAEVAQYGTLQLEANGIDTHDLDMPLPDDAVITWTATDPSGNPANDIVDKNGMFGPSTVTGDYTVTLTVTSGGKTFTATRTVTVKEPLEITQVCTGRIGSNKTYQIEFIGTRAYFTLIPDDPNDHNQRSFYYGATNVLNQMGWNGLTPNVAYPLSGFFPGDEIYFYLEEANPGHIQKLGTCDGLTILEDIIALQADDHTMTLTDGAYTIPVKGVSNYRTTPFSMPDATCSEALTFSGTGVNPTTGVFTPTAEGSFPITISYPAAKGNITKTITITVTGCTNPITVNLGADRTICQGETATFDAGTGFATYTWTGTGTDKGQTFEATASGTYSVTVTDGGHCTATDEVQLTVNANPAPAVADQTICQGETATFDAGADYSVYTWDEAAGTRTFSSTANGSHTLTVTDANGCKGTASFNLTVNALPTLSLSDGPTCSPDLATYTLQASVSAGTVTCTGGTAVDQGGNLWSVADVTSGNDITLTVTDNGCSQSLNVTSPNCDCPAMTAPVGGGDQTYCEGSAVPAVSATVNAGETVDWYDAPTGGNLLADNSLTYTPAAAGTYYAEARDLTTRCVSGRTPVTITMNAAPTLMVTDPAAVCEPATASVAQASEAGYTFAYYESDRTTLVADPAAIAASGTYYITKTDNVTQCVSDFAAVTVTVNEKPALTVTDPQAACFPATVSIAQAAETGYTFAYYGSDKVTLVADPAAIAASGTFYVTKTNDATTCVSDFTAVTVTVNEKPTLTVTDPQAVCEPATVSVAQTAEAGYTFTYYESDQATQVADPAAIAASGTFYITKTDNATQCVSDFAAVTVTVNEKPVLRIPYPNPACFPATVSIAQADETGYTFAYYESDRTTLMADPAAIAASGTFYVTKTNDATTCVSDFTLVAVTVNEKPALTVSAPAAACFPATVSIAQAAETGYTFAYYESDQATQVADPTAIAASGTFYLTKTNDDTQCVSDFAAVTVTVNEKPTLTVTDPAAVCEPATASITQAAEAGYTFTYYESDQATQVADPAAIAASGTFYLTKTNDATTCVSDFVPVNVTVNARPVCSVTAPRAVCYPATVSVAQADETGYTFAYYESDQATRVTDPAAIAASGTFYVTKTDNATQCVSEFTPVTVTVNEKPVLTVTDPQAVCYPATVSVAQAAEAGYTFAYYESDQATRVADPTAIAASGTFYLTKTNDATTCVSDFAAVTVTVNEKPVFRVTEPATVCEPATASVAQAAEAGYTFAYYESDQATRVANPAAIAASGTYYLTKTDNATQCVSDFVPVNVTVNARPVFSVTDPEAVCTPATVSVAQTAEDGYTFAYYESDKATQVADPTAIPASGTFYVTKTDDATQCVSVFMPVNVTVNAKPVLTVTDPEAVCYPATVSVEQAAETGYTFAYYESDRASRVADPAAIPASGTFYITKTDDATTCVSEFVPVNVTVNAQPVFSVTDPEAVCYPATVSVMQPDEAGYTFAYFEADKTTPLDEPTDVAASGTVYLTKTDNATQCVSEPVPVTVTVNEKPVLNLSDPAAVNEPETVDITLPAEAGYSFDYYTEDQMTAVTNPSAIAATGVFYITKTDDSTQCASDMTEIKVKIYPIIRAPLYFTPNDDGVNDTWVIGGLDAYPDAEVSIFNRYGKRLIVYKATDPAWDGMYAGHKLPSDDYWYLIDLNNYTKALTGHVTLMR